MAMGFSDVMPLSMLQHVQINLEEYRSNGKKSKKSAGDEYEEKVNAGAGSCPSRTCISRCRTAQISDICGSGDEESEIRAQIKKWEENMDVYDLTGQAIDMFTSNVRYFVEAAQKSKQCIYSSKNMRCLNHSSNCQSSPH